MKSNIVISQCYRFKLLPLCVGSQIAELSSQLHHLRDVALLKAQTEVNFHENLRVLQVVFDLHGISS